jgi:hypothetical protein
MAELTEQVVELPLEWHFPENLVTRYANNVVVQHGEHEFIISFFEVFPPILLGSPEETRTELDQIESVQANCVARIIIPWDRMPGFIKALQSNQDKFVSKMENRSAE